MMTELNNQLIPSPEGNNVPGATFDDFVGATSRVDAFGSPKSEVEEGVRYCNLGAL
jgi:hypothetical protein